MTIVEFICERNFLWEYSVVVQGGNKVTTPLSTGTAHTRHFCKTYPQPFQTQIIVAMG